MISIFFQTGANPNYTKLANCCKPSKENSNAPKSRRIIVTCDKDIEIPVEDTSECFATINVCCAKQNEVVENTEN